MGSSISKKLWHDWIKIVDLSKEHKYKKKSIGTIEHKKTLHAMRDVSDVAICNSKLGILYKIV